MRVGIHCYYGRYDATYAVLQAARIALELGHDVVILPREKAAAVHPVWDRYVVRGKLPLWEWLKGDLDYLICAEPLALETVNFARQHGVRCYLVCLWDELDQQSIVCLPAFDQVVFPSRRACRLVRDKTDCPNLVWVPWDIGVPVTRNPYDLDPQRVGLIWPLAGSQPFRQEPKFLSVVEQVLQKCSNAFFTVIYSDLPAVGQRDLKRLVQLADGRLEVMKGLSWDKQQYLYGRHDLTIWPSLSEGLGLVGLGSLHMGTPVIAWDHPLVGEVVKDRTNGILVPCELEYNWLDVPYVKPDYKMFTRYLSDLLREPHQLELLRYGTTTGLLDRRERFRAFWTSLLEQ